MTDNNSNNGIGIAGILGIIFVTLKLTNYIDWSWWYVTLPFWGVLALGISIMLIVSIVKLIILIIYGGGEK